MVMLTKSKMGIYMGIKGEHTIPYAPLLYCLQTGICDSTRGGIILRPLPLPPAPSFVPEAAQPTQQHNERLDLARALQQYIPVQEERRHIHVLLPRVNSRCLGCRSSSS